MFDRIRKALSRDPRPVDAPAVSSSPQPPLGPVSEWAASQGFGVSRLGGGQGIAIDGKVGGKPWHMELGKPTRNYILGEELRARAELGLPDDRAVLVMNRPLKEALEKKAYSMITDTLQTTADPNLPEEMRWIAMYDEFGWEELPEAFWSRYAVLADSREHAQAWIDASLARRMLDWPQPAPSAEVPFLLLITRGKAYLRMEHQGEDTQAVQHAALVFLEACEAALGGLATDVKL